MDSGLKILKKGKGNMVLICMPYAGGYSVAFRGLCDSLNESFTVVSFDPPGHGSNRAPLEGSIENLVDIYEKALVDYNQENLILFGHSMGGLIAFRLAQRLESKGIKPRALIISACATPEVVSQKTKCSDMNDSDFLQHVINIGGIPEELLKYDDLMEFFLPVFRADFLALEKFKMTDPSIIKADSYIFYGNEDKLNIEELTLWEKYLFKTSYVRFNGGHMFIQEESKTVASVIDKIAKEIII